MRHYKNFSEEQAVLWCKLIPGCQEKNDRGHSVRFCNMWETHFYPFRQGNSMLYYAVYML